MNSDESNLWIPNVLVLGPGGMKGYLELGVLKYLHAIDFLQNITIIEGCSIGSIIGLLYTVGYNPDEISTHSIDLNILNYSSLLNVYDAYQKMGVVNRDHIKRDLEKLVKVKLGKIPNLLELYNATGIEFTTVSTNLTTKEPVYLNYHTDPTLSCIDAVMLSINIPGVFPRIKYSDAYHIDGFFSNPYPVDYYDKNGNKVLGVYIETDSEAHGNVDSYSWYIASTFYSIPTQLRRIIIRNCSDNCKHIGVSSKIGINLTMDTIKRGLMLAAGWNTAKNFHSNLIGNKSVKQIDFEYSEKDELDEEIPVITDLSTLSMNGNVPTVKISEENQEILNAMNQYRRTGRIRGRNQKKKTGVINIPIPLPIEVPEEFDIEQFEQKITQSDQYQLIINQWLKKIDSISKNKTDKNE